MAEPAQVAALLLNWKRADLTLRCLADLFAVHDVPLHVFVLDNGSGTDEVAALQRGIATPGSTTATGPSPALPPQPPPVVAGP